LPPAAPGLSLGQITPDGRRRSGQEDRTMKTAVEIIGEKAGDE
jgi:hypothetical protein